MDLVSTLTSAFIIGLLGAGHCFAMCGGILAALALPKGKTDKSVNNAMLFSLLYQVGRISSYTIIGVGVGVIGLHLHQILANISPLPLLRIVAGGMLILLGFYISGWWRALTSLERVGAHLWKYIEPIGRRFLPIDTYFKALVVGMVWGWLPCGLVYSTLAMALAQGDALNAGLVMFAFGLGTLPVMWLGATLGSSLATLIRAAWFRSGAGLLMIIFGLWTIQIAILHSQHQYHTESKGVAPEHIDHHHHHH